MVARAHKNPSRTERHTPERTCVGCRAHHSPEDMLRCVLVPTGDSGGETIAVDWSGKVPGRGAYISPSVSCVEKALKRGGFQRSFKRRVSLPEVGDFIETMRSGLEKAIGQRLALARRAGVVEAGESRVLDCLKKGRGRLILLATDLSEGSSRKHDTNARRKGLAVIKPLSGGAMGRRIGRPFAGVVMVDAEPFASDLERMARMLAGLSQEASIPSGNALTDGERHQSRGGDPAGVDGLVYRTGPTPEQDGAQVIPDRDES